MGEALACGRGRVARALLDCVPLVGVAQLVELRVVVPAVAGSNPVAHLLRGSGSGAAVH